MKPDHVLWIDTEILSTFLEAFLFFEFALVTCLIIIALAMRGIIYVKHIIVNKKIKKLERVLINLSAKDVSSHGELIKKYVNDIKIILMAIKNVDRKRDHDDWRSARSNVIKKIALPLARKDVLSRDLYRQAYAVEFFISDAEKKDEQLLINLLQAKTPLIVYGAIIAIIRHEFHQGLEEVIILLSSTRWFFRTTIADYFASASDNVKDFVFQRLLRSVNPYERATCYNILTQFPATQYQINVEQDVASNNLELKIAALKFIAYVDRHAAIPLLLKALEEPNHTVKIIAIHRLANLHAIEATAMLQKFLQESNQAVRYCAIKALIMLNPQGKAVSGISHEEYAALKQMPYFEHMLW